MPDTPEAAAVQAAAEVLFAFYEDDYERDRMAPQDFAPEAREMLAAALPHLGPAVAAMNLAAEDECIRAGVRAGRDRIRELHRPFEAHGDRWCEECSPRVADTKRRRVLIAWPCDRIRVLDAVEARHG